VNGVSDVALVSRGELVRLLGPWLADDAADAELPVPILIDLTVRDETALARLRATLAAVAPAAQIDLHDAALAPVRRLLETLVLVAAALVALMVGATAIVVMLAARAGLETHRHTIEVMHMLGATDVQVARLFQRRLARDAALGAIAGAVAGLAVVALLARQAAGMRSELLGAVALGQAGWIVLAALPVAFILLAALVARRAVTRALGRVL
jgi:cell division transport system permease protein